MIRVIVEISSVGQDHSFYALINGAVIAINDFNDRDIIPTFHNTDGVSLGINRWIIRTDKKEPDKKTSFFSLLQATVIYRVWKILSQMLYFS